MLSKNGWFRVCGFVSRGAHPRLDWAEQAHLGEQHRGGADRVRRVDNNDVVRLWLGILLGRVLPVMQAHGSGGRERTHRDKLEPVADVEVHPGILCEHRRCGVEPTVSERTRCPDAAHIEPDCHLRKEAPRHLGARMPNRRVG